LGDELNVENTNEFRRKRPVPVPIYGSRYIERPYLKKDELSRIRDNLDELVDIKEFELKPKIDSKNELVNKIVDKPIVDKPIDNKLMNNKPIDIKLTDIKLTDIKPIDIKLIDNKIIDNNANFESKIEPKMAESKITEPKTEFKTEFKIEPKSEIKKDEIKIGISNLGYNKELKKIDVIDNIKVDNKIKKNKRKVNRMNDEEQSYNISPEDRRRMRKSEIEEYHNEKETNEAIKKAANLAEQNKKELEEMKKTLTTENAEIRNDLKKEFGNKFNELNTKFNDITGKFENVNEKFSGVSKKLDETCTGIECLKKDFAVHNKNVELMECPECNKKVVPPMSSYCPNCSTKINWFEDDGITPLKGWKSS